MMNVIPKWAMVALIAMLAATSCKLKIDKDGITLELEKTRTAAAEREAEYQTERAVAAAQLAAASEAVIETQNTWTTAMAEERNRTDETIRALQRNADGLRERLRLANQTGRAVAAVAGHDAGPSTASAAPRRDVEPVVPGAPGVDLVTEALRADTIRVELMACYEQYDRVRNSIIELNSEIVPQ